MRHLTLPLIALGLIACGEPFSNDVFEEDGRFIEAAPRMSVFRLSRGFGEGSQFNLAAEAPAQLYTATRVSLRSVDEAVFKLLREIDAIVESPPDRRSADARVWTPPRHPLDQLESRLSIQREGDRLTSRLERRPLGGAWVTLIEGWSEAEGTLGGFSFNLDAARALGLGFAYGQVSVRFERDAAWRRLEIDFVEFAFEAGAPRYDTQMIFEVDEEGGRLQYGFPADEVDWIHLISRWGRGGAGRAAARLFAEGGEVVWDECWGEAFSSVYSHTNVEMDLDWGDESRCAFEPLGGA